MARRRVLANTATTRRLDRRAGAGCREIIGGSRREERLEVFARNVAERGVDQEHYPHLSVPSVGRLRGRVREGVICTVTASSPNRPRLRAHPRLRHRPAVRERSSELNVF